MRWPRPLGATWTLAMETTAQLEEIVREIVAAVTGADRSSIDSATSMASLNLDSLSIVSIVSLCRARFETEFETSEILDLYLAEDFGDFVAAITETIERHR